MQSNYEKKGVEKDATIRMFCAYCRRSLANARTDTYRWKARNAQRERLFSDMRESELNRLVAPCTEPCSESVFDVYGMAIGVNDPEIADAIRQLDESGRAVVLLHYFADWSDRRIGMELGLPRSTVQFRRAAALRLLREALEEGGLDDDL